MSNILLFIMFCVLFFMTTVKEGYLNRLSPTTGHEPHYEPQKWNSDPNITSSHNCYAYMLDDINPYGPEICKKRGLEYCRRRTKPVPGNYTGIRPSKTSCKQLTDGMITDNPNIYSIPFDAKCKKNYKGALSINPGSSGPYHFFRQDNSGMWSQKFGHWKATNLDGDGKLIADPRTAKPIHKVGNEYKFCGYFCVPSNKYKETNTARLISNIRHPKNS
mgnify:CR=1 FL=1